MNMDAIGKVALVGGIIGLVFFALLFDVSVPTTTGGRVVNIGLMNDRSTGIMVCGFVAVLGLIAAIAGQRVKPAEATPPQTVGGLTHADVAHVHRANRRFLIVVGSLLLITAIVAAIGAVLQR